jgi:hypothetical protein
MEQQPPALYHHSAFSWPSSPRQIGEEFRPLSLPCGPDMRTYRQPTAVSFRRRGKTAIATFAFDDTYFASAECISHNGQRALSD